MLALLAQLAQQPGGGEYGPHGLFRSPSVYTLLDIVVTCVLVWIVWKRIIQAKPLSVRQYERLTGRLDSLELASSERDKRDEEFRRDVIGSNAAQLEAVQDQNKLLGKLVATVGYVRKVLDEAVPKSIGITGLS